MLWVKPLVEVSRLSFDTAFTVMGVLGDQSIRLMTRSLEVPALKLGRDAFHAWVKVWKEGCADMKTAMDGWFHMELDFPPPGREAKRAKPSAPPPKKKTPAASRVRSSKAAQQPKPLLRESSVPTPEKQKAAPTASLVKPSEATVQPQPLLREPSVAAPETEKNPQAGSVPVLPLPAGKD